MSDQALALARAPLRGRSRTPGRRPSSASPGELGLWIALGLAIPLLIAAAAFRLQANPLLAALVASLVLVAGQRFLLAWQTLLGAVLAVILFVPIRRYTVGGALPIELEPYRVLIAVVLGCWLLAMCADPRVRWRSSGLGAPIVAVIGAILLSLALNPTRAGAVGAVLVKQLSFFATYFVVLYFVASVITKGRSLDQMLRLLVAGGTLVAVLSLVEWRSGTNMFNWYAQVIPVLHYVDIGEAMQRGGGVRALGSAEHPIALGAALVMLLPLSVYLHQRDGRRHWLLCGGLLTMGALSTGSRTGTLMLVVLLVAFVCVKPRQTARLLPLLLPLLIVVQVAMPGTLGTIRAMASPSYVLKEQSVETGTGTGRVADLGPALSEWSRNPFVGQGFGTRIATFEDGIPGAGAQILDNQWLSELLEIGLVGSLAFLWLFTRAIRRLARRGRADTGPDGWLATALCAAIAAYAVGMLTFDAFAFIQVTFLAFIMLGFSAVVTRAPERRQPAGA